MKSRRASNRNDSTPLRDILPISTQNIFAIKTKTSVEKVNCKDVSTATPPQSPELLSRKSSSSTLASSSSSSSLHNVDQYLNPDNSDTKEIHTRASSNQSSSQSQINSNDSKNSEPNSRINPLTHVCLKNSKHKPNNTKEESKSTNAMPEPLVSPTVASTKPKRNGLLPFASRKISEDKKVPRRVSMSTASPPTGSPSKTKAAETIVEELTMKDSEKLAAGVGTVHITNTATNVIDISNIIAPPSSPPAITAPPMVINTGTTVETVTTVDTSTVTATPSTVDTGAITTSPSTPTTGSKTPAEYNTETSTATTSMSPSLTSTSLSTISTTKEEKRRRKRKDDVADLSIVVADGVPVITGYPMASPKRNKDYHTLFKDVPMTEYLINDYGCAWQREILAHGRMYISVNHLCFYANILGWVSLVVIPFNEITAIEKRTTAFVIPNAILITTHLTRYFFASFLARDTAFELLSKLWHHSQSVCNESEYPSDAGEQPKYDGNNVTDASETDDENIAGDGDVKPAKNKKPILHKLNKKKKGDSSDRVDMKSLQRSYLLRGDESHGGRSGTEDYRTSSTSRLYSVVDKRTTNSNQQSKRVATTCACLDKGHHYSNLVMDTKFTGSVEKMYNLLFNCDFLDLFLKNIEKCSDIKLGEWKPTQSNVLRRSSSYTMRLTHPIGPKSTKCFFEDECQHCDYDNYITNVTTTTTPDVPQGSCFVVKTRLCIMWAGANEVRVIVTCNIEWSKNAFFKTQIERGAVDGQRAYYKSLTKYIQNFIAMHPGEFQDDLGSPVPEMEQIAFEQSNDESVLAIENSRTDDDTQSSTMEETTFQHFFGSLSRSLPYELVSSLQSLAVSVSQPANILSAKSLVFFAFLVLLVSNVQILLQLRAINNQMVEIAHGVSLPANQAILIELRKRWTFTMLDTWYERDGEALREYFVKKFGELTV